MASNCFPVKIPPDLINSFTDLFSGRKNKHHILSQLFFGGVTCGLSLSVFGTVSHYVVLGDLGLSVWGSFCATKVTVNLLKRQPAKWEKKSFPGVHLTEDN